MNKIWSLPLFAGAALGIACSSSSGADSTPADTGGSNPGSGGAPSSTGGNSGAPSTAGGASGGTSPSTTGGSSGSAASGGSSASGAGGASDPSGGAGGIGGISGGAGFSGSPGGGGSGGGSAGSGGLSSAGGSGSSSRETICKFANGLNNPWINFGADIPNPNLNTFKTVFKNTHDNGGRIVRWWFHTNGTVTPGYDSSGMAKPLQQSHIDGLKSIFAAAHDAGLQITMSLWSFDMLQDNAGAAHTNNQKLLEVDANRQAYINNYLTPLVKALRGTQGLYAYEIFNEPEGMTPTGWATYRTQVKYIQACVNQFASAIHEADPTTLVTNGTQVFQYNSVGSGRTNNYSDSALRAAGGKEDGILDFYEVHYYSSNGTANSPFLHPASYWGLDKKLVMGEFYAQTTDGVQQNNIYTYLYDNGYNGGWGWAYDQNFGDIKGPMQTLYQAHNADFACPNP